jgi:hypothetical protein
MTQKAIFFMISYLFTAADRFTHHSSYVPLLLLRPYDGNELLVVGCEK